MKFCNTCQEQFADRFSFCPVDGTPLGVAPAPTVSASARDIETSYPVAESTVPAPIASEPVYSTIPLVVPTSAAASSAGMLGDYHLTILEDRGLLYRLAGELGGVAHNYQLTWPEFKRDPFGFVKRSIQGYGQMVGGFFGSRDIVIAMLFSFVAIAAIIGMVFLLDRTQSAGVSRRGMITIVAIGALALLALFSTLLKRDRNADVMGARPADSRNALAGIVVAFATVFMVAGGYFLFTMLMHPTSAAAQSAEDLELTQMITDIPAEQPTPDEGTAGMAKGNGGGSKPKQEKAGGGGGARRRRTLRMANFLRPICAFRKLWLPIRIRQ